MADQVERSLLLVVHDIEHLLLHHFVYILMAGPVHRLGGREPGLLDALLGPQPVEFQPHILPGELMVRDISGYLIGEKQKPLPAFDLVLGRFSSGGLREEPAGAGQA